MHPTPTLTLAGGKGGQAAAESGSSLLRVFTEEAADLRRLMLPSPVKDMAALRTESDLPGCGAVRASSGENDGMWSSVAALVSAAASLGSEEAELCSQQPKPEPETSAPLADAPDALSILSLAAARSDTRTDSEIRKTAAAPTPPASPSARVSMAAVNMLLNSPPQKKEGAHSSAAASALLAATPALAATAPAGAILVLGRATCSNSRLVAPLESLQESGMSSTAGGQSLAGVAVGSDDGHALDGQSGSGKGASGSSSGKENSEDDTPPGLLTSRSDTRSGSEDNSPPSRSPPVRGASSGETGATRCQSLILAMKKAGGGLLMSEWNAETDDEDASLCRPAGREPTRLDLQVE